MSDMHDALNNLARRGTPRGFDEVLGAASENAARVSIGRDAGGDDLDPIPFVTAEPVVHRRRPMGSAIAAAGVAALVLVGAFAVSAVVGSGGSGSPEGAVRRLADALSHEDPLAAADVLVPSEVRSLHGTLSDAERKAAELQLVQTAGAPLAGVDFNVDGLKLSTESLGNGYAKVTIDAGNFSASTHKAHFSALMQKVLRNSHDNSAQSDLSRLAASRNLPTFVVAVRRDGSWYVSAAYTVLEYVREANRLPAADFGSGEHDASTLGADSPDAAVQDSMRALQQGDWSKLMTMAPPDEIPVYDYRAAISALIDKNGNGAGAKPGFTISSMNTTSQLSGDTAKVTLTASGTTEHGTWSLDGGCFTLTRDGESSPRSRYPFTCGAAGPALFSLLAYPFSALDTGSQITVVQRDGRWFVSPVGTVLDVLDRTISQLDRRMVYAALDIPDQIPFDGALTLGTPVVLHVSPPTLGGQVLSFDGHKGEQLLGLATAEAKPGAKPATGNIESIPASARVFAPDGSELGDANSMLSGHALTLPTDGTYKVVLAMQIYGFDTGDVTVTIWDVANAPADAKKDRGITSCDYTLFGSSCLSSSGSTGPMPTSSVNSGKSCTTTGNETTCVQEAPTVTITPNTGTRSSTPAGVDIGNGISVGGKSSTATSVAVAPAPTSAPHG